MKATLAPGIALMNLPTTAQRMLLAAVLFSAMLAVALRISAAPTSRGTILCRCY